jgi:isoamylase
LIAAGASPGGYQVRGFPAWLGGMERPISRRERRFWKGDEGLLAPFGARLMASDDIFNRRGRKPWASVNFVTAHDGFTLNDLVSYNDKHNAPNGEDNRDGHNANHSWNQASRDRPRSKSMRRPIDCRSIASE